MAEETEGGMQRHTSNMAKALLRNPSFFRTKTDLITEVIHEQRNVHMIQKSSSPKPTPRLMDQDRLADPGEVEIEEVVQYNKMCEKTGISPFSMVRRQLGKTIIAIRNQGMNAKDMHCMCATLLDSPTVTQLSLDGNRFGDEGSLYLAALISDSKCKINYLSLSNNAIASRGIELLATAMKDHKKMETLILSGNVIGDRGDVNNISAIVESNHNLTVLDLSHNQLSDDSCRQLGSILANNDSLRSLNLSWNRIRPKGAVALAIGLQSNISLKTLDVSMNGFGQEGSLAVGFALSENTALTELDISHNRIPDIGLIGLAEAMKVNESLRHLTVGHAKLRKNPITGDGVIALLTALDQNDNHALRTLDISSVQLKRRGVEMTKKLSLQHPHFEISFAGSVDALETGISSSHAHADTKSRNPLSIMREFIESKGLRLVDFFKQMDKDGGGSISRQEFIHGLQAVDVPLTQSQLDDLMNTLDKDGDGEVDYGELVSGDKQYRIAQRSKKEGKRKRALQAAKP